jgi:hypothetical protein
VKPFAVFPSHKAPLRATKSLRERAMAPSSMTLSAANWATLLEPEMRAFVSSSSKPRPSRGHEGEHLEAVVDQTVARKVE